MLNDLHYEYEMNPYSTFRNFSVHPLSKSGFTQYISKESRVHKFIDINKHIKFTDQASSSTLHTNPLISVSLTQESFPSSSEIINTDYIVNTEPDKRSEMVTYNAPLNKGGSFKSKFLASEANSRNLRRDKKYIVTQVEGMSHSTFQKLNQIYHCNFPSKKNLRSSNGFKPDNVPRTKEDLSWIKKNKFEVSRIRGLEKTLFQSVCFNNGKTINSSDQELLRLYTANKRKEIGLNLPSLPIKEKHQVIEVNKVKFNKFFGDKYNPYNYEVHKEKINTCSLKDSFKNKKF